MELDRFANRHLDVPVAVGFVAVAARVTHGGHSATTAIQVLWPSTARHYKERRAGEIKLNK